jgi:hypothetical protein
MRQGKAALALVAAGCAFAMMATSAFGATSKEFWTTPLGKTKGLATTPQQITFGPVKITCLQAVAKGAQGESPSKTFGTSIQFSKCTTAARIGNREIALTTHFKTPVVIEYHNNHFVEIGSETLEEEGSVKLAGGEVELVINGGPGFKCHIKWETQTLPTRALKFPEDEYSLVEYINNEGSHKVTAKFPKGEQDRVIFKNEIKGIAHEFEGEQCETWGKEGGSTSKDGKYFGSIEQQIASGELEYRSAEEEPF